MAWYRMLPGPHPPSRRRRRLDVSVRPGPREERHQRAQERHGIPRLDRQSQRRARRGCHRGHVGQRPASVPQGFPVGGTPGSMMEELSSDGARPLANGTRVTAVVVPSHDISPEVFCWSCTLLLLLPPVAALPPHPRHLPQPAFIPRPPVLNLLTFGASTRRCFDWAVRRDVLASDFLHNEGVIGHDRTSPPRREWRPFKIIIHSPRYSRGGPHQLLSFR